MKSADTTVVLWVKPSGIGSILDKFQPDATINGKEVVLDAVPVIKNGRVLVPVRFLSEALGFTVKWHQDLHAVEIR